MTTSVGSAVQQVVSGTTQPSASSSTSSTSSDDGTLAGNFQTFLTLLTTQLQNQNPLDPLDTNQFTQQLVQFAGVEQQLKTNDQLASLVSGLTHVEGSFDRFLVREPLTRQDLTFGWGGRAPALPGSGLGVDVDEDAVRRIAVRTLDWTF